MSPKAQGLSLNTIIIAALVLVVLLIIVGIMTGYFSGWTAKFKQVSETSCSGSGGRVIDKTSFCDGFEERESTQFYEDVNENQKCCLKLKCGDPGTYTVCKDACPGEEDASLKGCPPDKKTCCAIT